MSRDRVDCDALGSGGAVVLKDDVNARQRNYSCVYGQTQYSV